MESEFRLKIVKIRESLIQGDIKRIAKSAEVSTTVVHKMFNALECKELTPAMKSALDAAMILAEVRIDENNKYLNKILEL